MTAHSTSQKPKPKKRAVAKRGAPSAKQSSLSTVALRLLTTISPTPPHFDQTIRSSSGLTPSSGQINDKAGRPRSGTVSGRIVYAYLRSSATGKMQRHPAIILDADDDIVPPEQFDPRKTLARLQFPFMSSASAPSISRLMRSLSGFLIPLRDTPRQNYARIARRSLDGITASRSLTTSSDSVVMCLLRQCSRSTLLCVRIW